MASTNAGNNVSFFVGGGGLNLAFEKTLMNAHQNTGAYDSLQTNLYNQASAGKKRLKAIRAETQ